jgi:hypothetical protein
MNRFARLGLSLSFAFIAIPALSQKIPTGTVHTQIEGIDIPPIAGAPFTAKELVTWDKPQVGGGTVSTKYYTLVARDSQGRVRREVREFIPANSTAEPTLRTFTILDPILGTRTTCTPASNTCATSAYNANQALTESAVARGNAGGESLGQQTIEGLPANGTRVAASNVSGARGSSRVAVSQTESWYSPDLQIDLSVTRTNPQTGVVTLNMTNIVRGEPDSTMLAIPSGFSVVGGKTQ